MRTRLRPAPLLAALLACTPATTEAPGTATPQQPLLPASTRAPTPAPAAQPVPETLEERHVSKSVGTAGGVTVLWPRIVPREIVDDNRGLAAALQQQMKRIVEKHLPGRAIDFRPEPERVCPKSGCAGVSVGLLISRQKQGCLVLALVSRPGVSPTKIVPWVGKVVLRSDTVGFREWPESQIQVSDLVHCNSLLTTMDAQEAAIAAALQAAAQ